jgi:hypothetical protein
VDFIQVLRGRLIGDLENGQRRQAHHGKSGRYNQRDAENGVLRLVWNRIRPICSENRFGPHCLLKLELASRNFNAPSCPNYSDTLLVSDEVGVQIGLRTKTSDQSSRQSQSLTTTSLLCSSLRRVDLRKERLAEATPTCSCP